MPGLTAGEHSASAFMPGLTAGEHSATMHDAELRIPGLLSAEWRLSLQYSCVA
jgi:hypothetical protein